MNDKRPTVEQASNALVQALANYVREPEPWDLFKFAEALDVYVDARIRRYLNQSGHGS